MSASGTTANVQMGEGPDLYSIAVRNSSTTTDIPANSAVIIDASNILENIAVPDIYVTLPTDTTNSSVIVGVTRTIIPAGGEGRMVPIGPVVLAVCDGTVTAGTMLDNSITSTKTGRVRTHAAGKNSFAIALATGADTDTIPIMLGASAPNA